MTETEEKPDTKTLVQQLRATVTGAMQFAETTMKEAIDKAVTALEIDQGLKEPPAETEHEEGAESAEGEEAASGDDEESHTGRGRRGRHRG